MKIYTFFLKSREYLDKVLFFVFLLGISHFQTLWPHDGLGDCGAGHIYYHGSSQGNHDVDRYVFRAPCYFYFYCFCFLDFQRIKSFCELLARYHLGRPSVGSLNRTGGWGLRPPPPLTKKSGVGSTACDRLYNAGKKVRVFMGVSMGGKRDQHRTVLVKLSIWSTKIQVYRF